MAKCPCCCEKRKNCVKGFKPTPIKSIMEDEKCEEEQQKRQILPRKKELNAAIIKKENYINPKEMKVCHNMSCYRLKVLTYNKICEQLAKSSESNDLDHTKSNQLGKHKKQLENLDVTKVKYICDVLNCSQMNFQIEKLNAAKDNLMRLQQQDVFDRMLGPQFFCYCYKKKKSNENAKEFKDDGKLNEYEEPMGEEEGYVCYGSEREQMELPPESEWHGHFEGYEILSESTEFSVNELKKCIEISHTDTVSSIEVYLRSGVRCFMIDLFKGNSHRNQSIVVRFRQSELNIAKELGFPITSTLFARLSPRLQYTGYLAPPRKTIDLCKDDCFTMTVDRYWASRCTKHRIFVNARYLMPDVRCCDVLLIGTEIQVVVIRVMDDAFRCRVKCGGRLVSRMPLLFHKRCHRFHMSFCELEDITFVKEVGINVIVSDLLGTKAYFENLSECLKLLDCTNLRIFASVVLNNIDDDEADVDWAKDAYDGFLGEISNFQNGCGGDGNMIPCTDTESSRLLFINPNVMKLIEAAHRAHKPFILDVSQLANGQYVMDPGSYKLALYLPDKYLFLSNEKNLGWFFMLANALGSEMPYSELSKQLPYCDESHTGSDTLALSTAAASLEMNASCIFVVGNTGRMATKIASFRPKATIYFISGLKSAANFVSIYYNIIMLYYDSNLMEHNHQKSVYTQFLFALSYALKLKSLNDGENVIFVYGQKPGQLFLDKYVAYKFNECNFVRDLACMLF